MKYSYAIVGGTFDHFHAGHKKLLFEACLNSQKTVIGLSTEILYKNKIFNDQIEDYATRKKAVENFLEVNNFSLQAAIIPLSDIYGNSLEEKEIEAIFVTEDTKPAAITINQKRKEKGFLELEIVVVPFVLADDGEKISSDRIRLGEIERNGFSYKKFLQRSKVLHLPESLREELRKPIGKITKEISNFQFQISNEPSIPFRSTQAEKLLPERSETELKGSLIISVGDIVTQDLIKAGIQPTVSIIDFKTQRHEIVTSEVLEQLKDGAIHFENQQGTINTEFAEMFQTAVNSCLKLRYNCHPAFSSGSQRDDNSEMLNQVQHDKDSSRLHYIPLEQYSSTKRRKVRIGEERARGEVTVILKTTTIIVEGEEDLLTLPAILLAPLGSFVVYGQMDVGAVVVEVTEEKKQEVLRLLWGFSGVT